MFRPLAAFCAAALVLAGCGGMKPEDFAGRTPELVLERYFDGTTKAWGIFEDRFGNLRREFVVDIEGTWDGELLTLVEDFRYSDGETEQRIWRIRKTGAHSYEGEADGVIGVAEGKAYGNALNWRYDFDLQVGDNSWTVHFNDWMFLQEDGVMINRAKVSKLGFEVGEATIFFRKEANGEAASGRETLKIAAQR